jgi:PKD repeat protein
MQTTSIGSRGLVVARAAVAAAVFVAVALAPSDASACTSPSSVSGTWVPGTQQLCGGTYNVYSLDVASGVTLTVQGGNAVTINAAATIQITGTINFDNSGYSGGNACSNLSVTNDTAGGGGLYGGASGSTEQSQNGGGPEQGGGGGGGELPYGTTLYGPGGGGGDCQSGSSSYGGAGGAGGGGLTLIARQIQIDSGAHVSVNGQSGASTLTGNTAGGGSGGGGAGGLLTLNAAESLSVSAGATIQANGGNGGSAAAVQNISGVWEGYGGNGGTGGAITLTSPDACASSLVSVSGGQGGVEGVYIFDGYMWISWPGSNGSNGYASCTNPETTSPLAVTGVAVLPGSDEVGTPVTVTVSTRNANAYRLEYQYDCTGTGSSYSAATTSNTWNCTPTTSGSKTVLVKVQDYNSVTFLDGSAPGTVWLGETATSSATWNVATPTFSVSVNAPSPVFIESGSLTYSATASSNSSGALAAGFTWVFDFGDGTTPVNILPTANNTNVSVSHAYTALGAFNLEVKATDTYGDIAIHNVTILVADPTPSVTIGTIPSPIYQHVTNATFTANASAPAASIDQDGFSYTFDFGDGTTPTMIAASPDNTSESVSHTYAAAGTYTLTVTVTNAINQTRSATASVVVSDPTLVVALGTVPSPIYAQVGPVTFTATATSDSSAVETDGFVYNFDFGDGTAAQIVQATANNTSVSTTHTYAAGGMYTLTLTVTDAAQDSASQTASVTVQTPTLTLGVSVPPTVYDAPYVTGFGASAESDSSAITMAGFTYVFDWGDGTSETTIAQAQENFAISVNHAYPMPGPFTLTMTATNEFGNSGQYTTSVTVVDHGTLSPPTVALTLSPASGEVAAGGTVEVTSATITDPNPLEQSGEFTFTLNFGNGAHNSGTYMHLGAGGVTNVGLQSAYPTPGTYTITFTVTDAIGEAGTGTATVTIDPINPTVSISGATSVPWYTNLSLTSTVSDPVAGDTYTYAWDFGDGTSSTSANPTKEYTTLGTWTIALTVTDRYGGVGVATHSVTTYDVPPTASNVVISPASPTGGTPLTLTWSYFDQANQPQSGTSIAWLVNGALATGYAGLTTIPSADVIYGQTWQAVVTPSDGYASGTNVFSNRVTIGANAPVVSNVVISPTNPLHASTLTLSYTYSDYDGLGESGTTIVWKKDGVVQTADANSKTVPAPLTLHDVWVATVTPSNGVVTGTAVSSAPVTVGPTAPVLGALSNQTVMATGSTTTVSWTVTGTDVDGSSITYDCYVPGIDFGSGPTYHEQFLPGVTTVTCSATANGVSDSSTFQVTVQTNLTVSLGAIPSPIYANVGPVTFSAGAVSNISSVNTAGFSYSFNFGDGTMPAVVAATPNNTAVSATHTYTASGPFTLTVTVTDDATDQGAASSTFVVNPTPQLTVTISSSPPAIYSQPYGATFTATAASSLAQLNTAGFAYDFDFGDGSQPTLIQRTPSNGQVTVPHTYAQPGTFNLTVTVTDAFGDRAMQVAQITVHNPGAPAPPNVSLSWTPATSTVPVGTAVDFQASIVSPNPPSNLAAFNWSFTWGDGTDASAGSTTPPTSPAVAPAVHTWTEPGTYLVQLQVIDEENLMTTVSQSLTISPVAPTVVINGARNVPRNTPLMLSATVSDPAANDSYQYAWDFGDNGMSSSPAPIHPYAALGNYTITLTVTDLSGAMTTASAPIQVFDQPPVATNVLISPTAPLGGTPLTLTWSYSDADNDPQSGSTITWVVDGQPVAALAGLATVPGSQVRYGERWQAIVTPNDGILAGASISSNTVVVGANAPVATSVVITPAQPRHTDTLTVTYQYGDADGLPESGTAISWTDNGVTQLAYANSTTVPPPLRKGDVWVATVMVANAAIAGQAVASAAVTVQNTPPVITPLSNISVSAAAPLTPVGWMVIATDVDGDALTYDCSIPGTDFGAGSPPGQYQRSLAPGTYPVTCTVSDGTAMVSAMFQIAVVASPPVVSLGANQAIDPGVVTVTGTATDPQGLPLNWSWSVSGPMTIDLSGDQTTSATFTALTAGTYTVSATVSDGSASMTAQEMITVSRLAPIADPGPGPRTMNVHDTITLDGFNSTDPNGGTLTCAWSWVSGPTVSFPGGASGEVVQMTASSAGEATIALTVSDGVKSDSANLTIEIYAAGGAGDAPVAVTGPNQVVPVGQLVTLDASASFDPDENAMVFLWQQSQGGPSSVALSAPDMAKTSFTPDTAGTYVFDLTVADNGLTDMATVTVTAVPAAVQIPVASVTPSETTIAIGQSVVLDGSGSTGAPGDTLSYQWAPVTGPYASLGGTTSAQCTFTALYEGTSVLQLVVTDGDLSSSPAQVTVHVTKGNFSAPVAAATGPATGYLGQPVVLDGSGSTDPNGLTLAFAWTQQAGPPVTLWVADEPTFQFTPQAAGSYSFLLTVSDGVLSATAHVAVNVETALVPVAVVTGPDAAFVGEPVQLSGSTSRNPSSTPLTYAWTQTSGPPVTAGHERHLCLPAAGVRR